MKINLLLFLTLFSLYSCTKKDSIPQNNVPVQTNAYFPMAVGNYWVYEFVNKDPEGNIIGNPSIDSIKIVTDTLINEKLFYVFETNKPLPNTRFMRHDSTGYIVDQHGNLKLLPAANEALYHHHYGYLGNDTAYSYWESFADNINVQSLVGNYTCLGRLAYHEAWPDFGGITSVDSNLYAPIGQLIRSYSYLSGAKIYGNLIDYSIED